MKEKKVIPPRGLRPLDAGGIFLMAQVTLYMLQSFIIVILGFFVSENGLELDGNMAVSFALMFFNQLSFGLIPFIYGKFKGISYVRELNPRRGLCFSQIVLLIIISWVTILAFMPVHQRSAYRRYLMSLSTPKCFLKR